jgi:hypothetical protein
LHQTSAFGKRKRGIYAYTINRIHKVLTTPLNPYTGEEAVFTEIVTEIEAADLFPFSSLRWGNNVTENFADFILMTNIKLTFNTTDDSLSDEVEYAGVRYRIVGIRHHDRLAYDDMFQYAIRRKSMQVGGI